LEKRHNLNLGWRIVLHCDPIPETKDIITESVKKGRSLESLMPDVFIKKHRAEMKRIAAELAAKKNDDIEVELEETQDGKIRIKLTNFYGCKGLSALHSIVVGMNDGSFPADPKHLTDDEICKFIVALTRARRSCTLVSNKEYNKNLNRSVDRPSTFIRMLPEDALQKQKCSMLNKKLRIQ
jgi:superfamily I DNA/RNA helicase